MSVRQNRMFNVFRFQSTHFCRMRRLPSSRFQCFYTGFVKYSAKIWVFGCFLVTVLYLLMEIPLYMCWFPFYDAERGIRTLKNDTVRASLNRMRMPISPSPQGEMTIWIVVNYDSYRFSAVKLTI